MARYLFGGGPADIVVQAATDDLIFRFAPGATITCWDSQTNGSQITDLVTEFGAEPVSTITSTTQGRLPRFYGPDSQTEMWIDSGDGTRYVINSTDIGGLINSKLGRDEIPASHTHSVSEVIGLSRSVGAAIGYAYYDPTTNTWPTRPDTPGPVIWIGDALRPGADQAEWGLDYVDQIGTTNIPDPTPDPDEDPDVNNVVLTTPIASPNGAIVSLSATLTTEESMLFAYAQIAVRGPGGQQSDTAFNNNVTVDGTLTLTGTFTASVGGTWRAYISYNLTGGASQSDWIDGPAAVFVVTLPAPGTPVAGGVPLVSGRGGGSGLLWNSGCFKSSSVVSVAQAFGTWRGKPIDAFLTFQGRSNWASMFYIDGSWAAFTGVIVNSIPPQPETDNDAATAAGSNNTRWEGYGQALTAAGLNRNTFIIRVWEVNGNWYKWSWGNENGSTGAQNTPDQFVAAIKNMSQSIKKYAPNVKISVNVNRGNKRAGTTWQSVLQQLVGSGAYGKYMDIVGLDSYDWYPGQINSTTWNTAINQQPGHTDVAAFVRANGLQMSMEEWACIDASGGSAGGAGGDNAYYIQQMWLWFVANKDIIAYEGYYDDNGAPATLLHKISDGSKPNAAAAYRSSSRWGNL